MFGGYAAFFILPFKGRSEVGMGLQRYYSPIPIPAFPLKGKE